MYDRHQLDRLRIEQAYLGEAKYLYSKKLVEEALNILNVRQQEQENNVTTVNSWNPMLLFLDSTPARQVGMRAIVPPTPPR